MKKILLFLFTILSFSSYAQISKMGGMASRVNDSSAYVTNATVIQAHADGYHDIWLSNASNLFWVWNGSAYVNWIPSGSGGWVTTGVQTLTGPFGVESADSIGIASNDVINIRTSANNFSGFSNGDFEAFTDFAFTGVYQDGATVRSSYQAVADGGIQGVAALQAFSTGAISYSIFADTLVYRTPNNVKRFKIDPNGSWHLGTDPGTAGYVLQSNGAGVAPTWVAPSGGGTWGSITGTLSSQTDLQAALDLKAPLASPTFTGTPAAPTAAFGTNTTQVATTAFVQAAEGTWTDWSSGLAPTGFSSTTVQLAQYIDNGKYVIINFAVVGTSNATSFTITLPSTPNATYGTAGAVEFTRGQDNGVVVLGTVTITNSTTVTLNSSLAGGAFTASGTKGARGTYIYRK